MSTRSTQHHTKPAPAYWSAKNTRVIRCLRGILSNLAKQNGRHASCSHLRKTEHSEFSSLTASWPKKPVGTIIQSPACTNVPNVFVLDFQQTEHQQRPLASERLQWRLQQNFFASHHGQSRAFWIPFGLDAHTECSRARWAIFYYRLDDIFHCSISMILSYFWTSQASISTTYNQSWRYYRTLGNSKVEKSEIFY